MLRLSHLIAAALLAALTMGPVTPASAQSKETRSYQSKTSSLKRVAAPTRPTRPGATTQPPAGGGRDGRGSGGYAGGDRGPRGPRGDGGWHGGHRRPSFGGLGIVPGIIMTIPTMIPPAEAMPPDDGYDDADDDANAPPPRRRHTPPPRAARRGPSGAPAAIERRLVPDEIVIELPNTMTAQAIGALQRRHRLTRIESQRFALTDTTLYRWRIPDRRSVATVVRALERDGAVTSAQPNYLFALQQAGPPTADAKPAEPKLAEPRPADIGDKLQYLSAKLRLTEAHALAKGDGVLVAVIDSAIDADHPELAGAVTKSFDTLKSPFKPHAHGTAIAALIAGHAKLAGAAPAARILAVRAFDPAGDSAEATTFNILKGIDWAAANGARVINMSFAGPADPAIHRSLEAAVKKGIILIAAAGNAGPKSPPLYPAADPNVLAVTATDADDKLFDGANRGRHVAVAAPGFNMIVATPDGGYHVSNGTSYSAAEVSGIAALMIQRRPDLKPTALRAVLLATAKDLGPKGRDDEYGAGLADAYRAVAEEGPPTPVSEATPRR
jgi:hypothetical protein